MSPSRAGRPPRLTKPGPVPAPISRWHPTAPAQQKPPTAESGTRPARALPYQASVSGSLDASGKLALKLANGGRASAHFAIYPYAGELPEPAHRDVLGILAESLAVPGDAYRVVVQGPNRGWWGFRGTRSGVTIDVRTRFVRGGLELTCVNTGASAVTLRLTSPRYGRTTRVVRVPARRSVPVTWPVARGWYDVRVTADGDPAFLRTLTGRVEDGGPGTCGQ